MQCNAVQCNVSGYSMCALCSAPYLHDLVILLYYLVKSRLIKIAIRSQSCQFDIYVLQCREVSGLSASMMAPICIPALPRYSL